ncbi:MAG: hypothetical protein WAL29_09475 [Bacteroidales bacterium]
MVLTGYISRAGCLSLSLLLLCTDAASQAGSKNYLQINDTSKSESGNSRHSFFAGTGYGSNMIYLGSTISRNQPYGYAALSYGFNSEFYASFSTVHLSGVNPFLPFHIGSINYNHVFNSWFDISTGVYRYQVARSLADTLFSSFSYADLTLGFDWRILYTKISAGGLLSDENGIYFQIRNSRYFKTPDFLNDKANISFDPYVNILFGTLIEKRTSTETSVIISTPARKWRKYPKWTTPTVTYAELFGLMEVDFGVPVAFNTDRMSIEAEPGFVLPLYEDPDFPGSKGFNFMLSGYFRIF